MNITVSWPASMNKKFETHTSGSGAEPMPPEGVVGILVAYENTRDLSRRLGGVTGTLDRVVVVDNAPIEDAGVSDLNKDERVILIRNGNAGGLAGAYNRAIREIESWPNHPKYILFLDDDSDLGSVAHFVTSRETLDIFADVSVAAAAPMYVDPATGMPGSPVRLGRWSWRALPRTLSGPVDVSFLINSMSMWKWSAVRRIGDHRTDLGVDHVDTDYCLRARFLGYRLILNPAVKFSHSIGARRKYSFLGRTFQAGGHSPARRWSIARNSILLAKQYGGTLPSFAFLAIARLAYEGLGILMVESEKRRKLWALVSGAATGLMEKSSRPPQVPGNSGN